MKRYYWKVQSEASKGIIAPLWGLIFFKAKIFIQLNKFTGCRHPLKKDVKNGEPKLKRRKGYETI